MFFKSIRFKITILYMAILALTLSSFSVVLYHNVSRRLYGNMDTLLKSKAGGIAQAIDTYWEASKFEAIEAGGLLPEVLKKRRNINFAKVAQRWVKEESSDPALLDIIVQVFDTDGAIIASSKNTKGLPEILRKSFISVLQGKSRFDTLDSDTQSGGMAFRLFTTPVFENEKVAYIVQVASPLASIQTALNNLKVALFILFPITVLATGLMGALLAKVSLRPVDSMVKAIHEITAENLKLKLAVPATKDEIQKLAETFNDMLGRLEAAFSSQRQLFADLSHELKTPLTILKGEFEVMLKKERPPQEYERILKSALEEIDRIAKLAEGLLILAKFDSKEARLDRQRLDLNLLAQAAINKMKALSELKQIGLSFNGGEKLLIEGDEAQLKTAFLNILDNAVKYTAAKGRISVTAGVDKARAKVSIEDTGVGIPEEELPHVFDRFYRVDKSRNPTGFGLGLSIAKSIVEAHGGSIAVRSLPPRGTAFTIFLPLAQPH